MNDELRVNLGATLNAIFTRLPGYYRVRSVRGLVAPSRRPLRRFLLAEGADPVRLRLAGHFDLDVDALVHDGVLGSLGLVWSIPADDPDKAWVRQCVDRAAYVRHLLLEQTRPGKPDGGKSPLAVEVVFAIQASSAEAAETARSRIGEALREITRDESYLDAVGINVWLQPASLDQASPDDAFHRAFSWLLHATGLWFEHADGQPKGSESGRVLAVELTDFRVAGPRKLELVPEEALHLVFGHNGSGKSSFCEAIELLVTGALDRLSGRHREEQPNYAKVITNRPAFAQQRRATIRLRREHAAPRAWTVEPGGLAPPLGQGPAASFRLDQSLADELAQGDDVKRARLFVSAFFPEKVRELDEFKTRLDRCAAMFGKLPEPVRQLLGPDPTAFDSSQAVKQLQPVSEQTVTWEALLALLPIPQELRGSLAPLLPQAAADVLRRSGSTTANEAEPLLATLDQGLAELISSLEPRLQAVQQALELLEEYGEAAVAAQTLETGALGPLLNRWLEWVALADLMEREDQVLSTLDTARASGQAVRAEGLLELAGRPPSPAAERQQRLARARAERDELRQRVTAYSTPAERTTPSGKVRKRLNELQPHALDQVAQWGLLGEPYRSAAPGPGTAVRRAYQEQVPVPVMSAGTMLLTVGAPGWGRELLQVLRAAKLTLDGLTTSQARVSDPSAALSSLWPALRQLHAEAAKLNAMDREYLLAFTRLVEADKPLGRAVNEVMALLTPARWAYQDVSPRLVETAGDFLLEVRTEDQVHTAWRLNTAELNTFALSMFLLCAPRVGNPLQMVVLDDPLQNMDELTVTTVARGLGRLLRLWRAQPHGADWTVLMMLHDESSLQRVRNETPCAAYVLPWLSPHDPGVSKPDPGQERAGGGSLSEADRLRRIKELRSLLLREFQSLRHLVISRPKPKQGRGSSEPSL